MQDINKLKSFIIPLVCLAACSEKVADNTINNELSSIKPDPAIENVNKTAAYMEFDIRVNKYGRCKYKHSIDKIKNGNDPIINDLNLYMEGLCAVYSIAEEKIRPTFTNIKSENKMPDESYVFSIFTYYDNDKNIADAVYEESEIGLFQSLETCEDVENVAREYKIPTRKCDRWVDITAIYGNKSDTQEVK